MRPLTVLSAAALLCLVLTSCELKSDHPLSPAKAAQTDPRLIGDWADQTEAETYRFTVTNEHWMHVEIIPAKPGKRKIESYDLFQTVIGGETYLNVHMSEKHDKGTTTTYYEFVRYTISRDDVLQMWSMSESATADAVRAGKLKGTVDEVYDRSQPRPLHPDVNVTLHDTSDHLQQVVGSANIYALFSEKMHPLTRVSRK
jgi:hypothetical protein